MNTGIDEIVKISKWVIEKRKEDGEGEEIRGSIASLCIKVGGINLSRKDCQIGSQSKTDERNEYLELIIRK